MIDWTEIDTVLLDMDGTLLDLEFDNVLWNQRLPERFAIERAMTTEAARDHLFAHMRDTRARLEFYCLDYWAKFTALDIVGLHRELKHLIRYRPSAAEFVTGLHRSGKRAVLVTNAHRDSVAIKDGVTGLLATLHRNVSSHDFAVPKEDPAFWHQLGLIEPFDPQRTLLIDDNADVLDSAASHGIRHLRTIAQPDSGRPRRDALRHIGRWGTSTRIMP
ncbi:MAG: HAD hydrolase-like protein [Gammaproteobacteria bacterium]|nr:HAD hydrolase-like protein [Gammaproteobacteria bacterium]